MIIFQHSAIHEICLRPLPECPPLAVFSLSISLSPALSFCHFLFCIKAYLCVGRIEPGATWSKIIMIGEHACESTNRPINPLFNAIFQSAYKWAVEDNYTLQLLLQTKHSFGIQEWELFLWNAASCPIITGMVVWSPAPAFPFQMSRWLRAEPQIAPEAW